MRHNPGHFAIRDFDMSATGKLSNEKSATRPRQIELAEEQTVWAAERTLLAWIRTSMSMITFGFVIGQFSYWAGEAGIKISNFPGKAFGFALMVIGTFSMVLAAIQHVRSLRGLGIGRERGIPRWSLSFATAILLALLGCFALTLFIWSAFP